MPVQHAAQRLWPRGALGNGGQEARSEFHCLGLSDAPVGGQRFVNSGKLLLISKNLFKPAEIGVDKLITHSVLSNFCWTQRLTKLIDGKLTIFAKEIKESLQLIQNLFFRASHEQHFMERGQSGENRLEP